MQTWLRYLLIALLVAAVLAVVGYLVAANVRGRARAEPVLDFMPIEYDRNWLEN